MEKAKKDFISISDLTSKELWEILNMAKKLKEKLKNKGKNKPLLRHKTLVAIFEKPSLRTRLSFESGMTQLGGHAIYFGPHDIGMGKREEISDVAMVASSMGDLIMARTYKHKTLEELERFASIPVINGLSDFEHPCQTLADLLTIWEVKGRLNDLTIAFVGDGENNVAHSLCLGAGIMGLNFKCASPRNYFMDKKIVAKAKVIGEGSGATVIETEDVDEAVSGANVVYTDTWVSMGDEKEKTIRMKDLRPYQVTDTVMKLAKKEAIFMHDLPAYRGCEATGDVIDGIQSVIFQQAENRLHAQKALILFLLNML